MKQTLKKILCVLEGLYFPLLVVAFASCTDGGFGSGSSSSPAIINVVTPSNGANLTSLAGISGTYAISRSGETPIKVEFELLRDSDGLEWNGSAWVAYSSSTRLTATHNTTAKTWQSSVPLPSGSNPAVGLITGTYGIRAILTTSFSGTNPESSTAVSFKVGTAPSAVIPVAYSWGYNFNGELGAGPRPSVNAPIPVTASGVLDGEVITDIAAGAEHTLALTQDGKVYVWGSNVYGQLGTDNFINSDLPVMINMSEALIGKRIVGIGAGEYHSFVITADNLIFAWGHNQDGKLGIGVTGGVYPSPTAVVTSGVLGGKQVTAITGGGSFSLARTSDGLLYSWGANADGQLGTGDNTPSNVPVGVKIGPTTRIASMDAGSFHSVVVTTLGEVLTFGLGTDGLLGNGAVASANTPVLVGTTGSMAGRKISQVSATRNHSLALGTDGRVYAWGSNVTGGLGDNSLTRSLVPVVVAPVPLKGKKVTQICSGWYSSYAYTLGDELIAWGINYDGNLAGANAIATTKSLPAFCNTTGVITDTQMLLKMVGGWRHGVLLTMPRLNYLPDIAVEAANTNVESDANVNCGSNGVGHANTVHVTVRNLGRLPLDNITRTITGAGFSAPALPQTSLAQNEMMEFDVTFTPSAVGPATGLLTLASNDPDESPFTLNLTGTGLALGDLDTGVGTLPVVGTILGTATQPDGDVIIHGSITHVNGITRNGIARLSKNGTELDESFDPNVTGQVNCVAIQLDGKIVIGGNFTHVGGQARNNVARVNADGTLDTSFGAGTNGVVSCLHVQSDERILVGGAFTMVNDVARGRLARLRKTGSLDSSFNALIESGEVRSVVRQTALFGNQILIGGTFDSINDNKRISLARLDANGGLDASFIADAPNGVNAVCMLPDGRILAAGDFTTIKGTARNGVARLSQAGVVDTAYSPNVVGSVISLAPLTDGRLLISGTLTTVSGVARIGTARLQADGALDAVFNPIVAGGGASATSVELQPDGKILLAGNFTNINSITRNGLARLSNANAAQTVVTNDPAYPGQIHWRFSGASPQAAEATLETSTDNVRWTLVGQGSQLDTPTRGWQWPSASLPVGGLVRLRAILQVGYRNGSGTVMERIFTYNPPVLKVDYGTLTNVPNFSSVDFGAVRTGSAKSIVFTITNTGGAPLTGVPSGVLAGTGSGEFSIVYKPLVSTLAPAGNLQAIVTYRPRSIGSHIATFTLPTNAPATPSYQLTFRGMAGQPIGTFRRTYFGRTDNTGTSADSADPDGDSMSNLAEYGLGTNPTTANAPANGALNFTSRTFDYTRNRLALADVEFQVEWNSSLSGEWRTTDVSEIILSETAETQRVRATLPPTSWRFVRIRMNRKP